MHKKVKTATKSNKNKKEFFKSSTLGKTTIENLRSLVHEEYK